MGSSSNSRKDYETRSRFVGFLSFAVLVASLITALSPIKGEDYDCGAAVLIFTGDSCQGFRTDRIVRACELLLGALILLIWAVLLRRKDRDAPT